MGNTIPIPAMARVPTPLPINMVSTTLYRLFASIPIVVGMASFASRGPIFLFPRSDIFFSILFKSYLLIMQMEKFYLSFLRMSNYRDLFLDHQVIKQPWPKGSKLPASK